MLNEVTTVTTQIYEAEIVPELEMLTVDTTVQIAQTRADIRAAKQVLDRILHAPFGLLYPEKRDVQESAVFVIAKDGEKVVGAGKIKLSPRPEILQKSGLFDVLEQAGIDSAQASSRIANFVGIAVEPEYRRKGIGNQLYEARERIALHFGKTIFFTHARPDSWSIFKNRGYTHFKSDHLHVGDEIVERKYFYKRANDG